MEEMLYKCIDKGKREQEEMRAFIHEFRTTNELLFKERNNSLSELRFEVQGLSRVINNTPISNLEVKGVTTRGGKTMTQNVKDNDTNIHTKEPLVINHDEPVESNETKEKEEAQEKKFLENLKQLHINLPFIEALSQMPKYAKLLKGLLTNRARLKEAYMITMNERCSTVLLNKLPLKEKDPGSFTIPCDIGQLHINNALADLGASISLMSYTMYEKLSLGEPKATRMSLELADRPFLAIARAMIDVFNKKKTLRVGDDDVIFDMDQSIMRSPTEDDECYGVDDLDDEINAEVQELLAKDMTGSFLLKGLENSIEQSDLESCECEAADESDSIWRIEAIHTPYPVAQKMAKPNKVEREQLYLASANKIDEKKPELKILP
ncbi:DNA-directed DNA polymerase [Tanacetum coccineum]